MNSNGNRKRYRIRKGRVAGAAVLLASLVALVAFLCVFFTQRGKNNNNSSTSGINTADYVSEGEFIRINLLDCNMYVGSVLTLQCLVYPQENAGHIIWSSSNDEIVSVNDEGVIIVKGTGIAAITATSGVLSDSVIINGVDRDEPDTDEYMPVIDVIDDVPTVVESAAIEQSTRETFEYITTENHTENTISNEATTDNGNAESSGTVTERDTTTDDPDSDTTTATQPSEDGTTDSPTKPIEQPTMPIEQPTMPIEQPTNPSTEPVTETEGAENMDFARNAVTAAGFTRYLDNIYIFREDGYYLGEIIIEENYLQIYMMTRTRAFDTAVKSVMKEYLPNGYETVHARFVGAAADQTFSIDGHRVRIVAGVNGGHSQLIIFYAN